MVAIARRSSVVLFGAFLLAPLLHALPAGGGEDGGEDDCVHLVGYGGAPQGLPVIRPRRTAGTSGAGGALAAGICAVDNARGNDATPTKTNADFVPVTGDDALGFYSVYGVKASTTGGVGGNVGIFLFELTGGEVLVFGSGYGNIPGANLFDAAYDMERVDQVIRFCMGRDPATTPLRLLAPHGHGDHINPACNRELERLGYSILEIAFHPGDFAIINGMSWTAADRTLFRVLPVGTSCLQELVSYSSPLGKLWAFHRPGHTDGSIDLVIDVGNDVTNRFVVRGSQAGSPCAPLPGQREIIDAHGNAELFSVPPTLVDVTPLAGTALGGTTLSLSGAMFTASGAGTPRVLLNGAPATDMVVNDDTSLSCRTPSGPPGELVEVAVVNNNGKAVYAGTFFYNPQPTLTSILPNGGDWRGGTTVQVRGSGFLLSAGVNEIFFGTARATGISVKSDSLLTCRAPAGTPGSLVTVRLRNPNGEAKIDNAFRYSTDLAITSVDPPSASALGGTIVLLSGIGFNGTGTTPAVTFGGVASGVVTLLSDTTVLAVVPPGPQGSSASVVLTNSAGSATFTGFRYHAFPVLTSLTPTTGRDSGGTTVTLSGSGFQVDAAGTNQVRFGGAPAAQVTVLGDGSLRCTTPAGVRGTSVNVTVSNQNGTAALPLAFTYAGPLEVTSLLPVSGTSLGGTTVTLTGTGFVDGPAGTTTVRFGGVLATQVVAVDNLTLTCRTPAGTPAAQVDLELSNQNGTVTLPTAFRYHARPTLTAVSPNHGFAGSTTQVTLTGTGFLTDQAGTNTVTVGGVAATNVVVVSNTSLTCRFPAGTAGTSVNVGLSNQNGSTTLTNGFRYHATPTLTVVTPNHGNASAFTPVTLSGTGFLNDSAGLNVITVGGNAATSVQVLGDTSILCNFPPGNPGTSVNVVLSNQNGSATLTNGFRYHAGPSLTGLAPTSGGASQQQRITLTGAGFLNDNPGTPTITFGGLAASAVSVTNDTSLRCNAPVGPAGQTVDVVLINGRGTATLPQAYRFHARPALTAVAPAAGSSQGGTQVTLTGSGFLADGAGINVVNFGGSFASNVVVVNDTTVRCTTPPGVLDAVVDVVVSNTNGTGTLPGGFSYSIAPPVVLALAPASGPAQAPGTVVISGSGFLAGGAGTNAVRFGSLTSGIVAVLDDTRLSCLVPAGTPGTSVDVLVTNANGQGQLTRGFRYHALPVLSALAPASGGAAGGTVVTLTGTGFVVDGAGTNLVTFGGLPAQGVTVVNNTTLTCLAPSGPSGATVDVRLSNANGQTAARTFGYHPKPSLLATTPASGPASGGTRVVLRGTGFLNNAAGPNSVRIGKTSAANVLVVSDSELACIAPRGDGGFVDVTLSNANGSATLVDGFFYGKLAPTLTAIEPVSGPARGQGPVTIRGRGFEGSGTNNVRFGAALATGVVTLDDETLQCTIPAGKPGTRVDVSLDNESGATALAQAYRYHDRPTLTSVSPTQGEALKETRVSVMGSGFTRDAPGETVVLFGGIRARDVVVKGDGLITCKALGGGPGAILDITVRNANGSATLEDAYRVIGGPPTIESMTPGAGPFVGGTLVTFVGKGFSAAPARVLFGDQPGIGVTVSGDTSLTCLTPPGTLGTTVSVSLSTKNGSAVLVGGYSYEAIRPELTGIAPDHGPAAGGTKVTLTGRGFTALGAGTPRVSFSGVAATGVAVLGDTSVTCNAPAGNPATNVDIVLENGNGRSLLARAFRYHAAPTLSAVTPAVGRPEGGTLVTLTGTGFSVDAPGTNQVLFEGVAASSVSVISNTLLACSAPPGIVGTAADVTLTNQNGSVVLSDAFRYRTPPRITAVVPANGPASGGTALTITGTGFQAGAAGINQVTIGGVPAFSVATQSDTTITCTTPAGAVGQKDVMVTNDNGSATAVGAFNYVPAPVLTSIAPAHGPARGGTRVTLTGNGFQAAGAGPNRVLFGGVPATDVVTSAATTILCTAPAGASGARVDVRIENANGAATLAAAFRYHAAPVLTQVTPDHGPRGGAVVTLIGRGFQLDEPGTNAIAFGGVAATQVVVLDDTRLSCRVPAGAAGTRVDVTLANVNGASVLSAAWRYHAEPTLTSLSPVRGPSAGGTRLTLTGTGFQADEAGATQVIIGGFGASEVSVVSDTTLTCLTPAGNPDQRASVTVANANGAATLVDGFRYNPLPTLASLQPTDGPALGGTTVTLTGSGFVLGGPGPNTVRFGSTPATIVSVPSDTTLICAAPPGTAGTSVDVSLSNLSGTATLVAGFRYRPPPALSAAAPAHGPASGGTIVTLTGSGFAPGAPNSVLFGGLPATGVSVLDDATLTCVSPAGAPGAVVDIELTNLDGAAMLAAGFRYHARPVLAGVAPAHGSSRSSTAVTLTGSGFLADDTGANTVLFGSVAALGVSVLDDATLTCQVAPQAADSVVDVTLANANGQALLAAAFAFDAVTPPLLTGLAPASGRATGDTTVTLSGSGFQDPAAGTTTVTFGAASAAGVVVLDDATVQCQTPAGAVGAKVDVTLANQNGSTQLAQAFTYLAPAPTLTGLIPASGPGAGSGPVTLTGSGFLANAAGLNTVTFAGLTASNVSVVDDATLTCRVPAGSAGTQADVELRNANGATQLPAGYRYHALPEIFSVNPPGGTSLGGTLVTVRGSGFQRDAAGTVSVRFGDRPASTVNVLEDGRLTCRAPSGPAGTSVTVALANANGTTQMLDGYKYSPAPTLTAVTPADGTALGGTRVTLTGTGFLANGASQNAVTFASTQATSVVVRNDRTIECTAPPGTSGISVLVSLNNVNGAASLPSGYRYHARPSLTSLTPPNGPVAGGTLVTLTGSGFQVDAPGTNRLTFGGRVATSVNVVSDTQLTCRTPAGAATGPVDVVISNDNGANTLLGGFIYGSIPIVVAALPGKGTTQGSTAVTVTGSGFDPDTTVFFGSEAASSVVVVDENTIQCLTPPAPASGWVDLGVSSSAGSHTLPLGFLYAAPPTLAAVEPPVGAPQGGALVILSGSGFLDHGAGENRVTFGGQASPSVTVLDDQHLASEVPAGQVLTEADIELVNDNGSALLARGFRWQLLLATDLNSDGRGDVILGSPGDDTLARDAGAVRVFFGSALPVLDKSSTEADLTALPERVATAFGMPVAAGDLDGDGNAELVIGAPLDDARTRDAGAVYVFAGPLAASPATLTLAQASTVLSSPRQSDRFGSTLALGDLDRDGVLDLLVGVPGNGGSVQVFTGGATGLAAEPVLVIPGVSANEGFASSLAAGDLDGDGWAEIVVGSPSALGLTTGPTARPGAVRVYRGGSILLTSGAQAPWLSFAGVEEGEGFGSALSVADLSADGIDDLVIGSPWNSRAGLQSGAAFTFFGRSDLAGGNSGLAQAILDAEAPGDRFGIALHTGDVDGDGQADLLVGAPLCGGSGRAYLFRGDASFAHRLAAQADIQLTAEVGTQGEFGRSVALIDVDGNGRADMIVTAPRLDAASTDIGRVYVFGASALATREGENDDATLTGNAAGDLLGRSTTGDH